MRFALLAFIGFIGFIAFIEIQFVRHLQTQADENPPPAHPGISMGLRLIWFISTSGCRVSPPDCLAGKADSRPAYNF